MVLEVQWYINLRQLSVDSGDRQGNIAARTIEARVKYDLSGRTLPQLGADNWQKEMARNCRSGEVLPCASLINLLLL